MTFSVIVPTYNRQPLLEKCLQSLFSQSLAASDFEVIVVDDGSTDGTREYLLLLRAANFRYLTQEHLGPASARNLGAKNALGKYLAFTDDDCLVPPNWLKTLAEAFEGMDEAGAVGGYLEAPDEILERNPLAQLESFETHVIYGAGREEYLGGFESPAGGTNNVAYRRPLFEKLGGFDVNFPVPAGEDADLKLRTIAAGYKVGFVPLKMIHLDPYSLKSFWRRSISSGVGSAYFEEKNFQRPVKIGKLAASTLRSLSRGLLVLFRPLNIKGRRLSRRLSFLVLLRSLLMDYGRLKYWRRSGHRSLLVK